MAAHTSTNSGRMPATLSECTQRAAFGTNAQCTPSASQSAAASPSEGSCCILLRAMRTSSASIWFAGALVVAGVVLLLVNLGVFGDQEAAARGALFALGGIAFLAVFARDREHWWALIPGCALLGLGATALFGSALGAWSGALFLGAIGVSFGIIFLIDREHWWALIPGGVLLTLALVSGMRGNVQAGVFFFGLAVTFALVAVAPTPDGRQTWAWIPSVALALVGAMTTGGIRDPLGIIWPAALILAGGFLILRRVWHRR